MVCLKPPSEDCQLISMVFLFNEVGGKITETGRSRSKCMA